MKHPTPWSIEEISTDEVNILDADGHLITSEVSWDCSGFDRETAERIITAVNGYEQKESIS